MASYSEIFKTPRFLFCDEPVKDETNKLPFRNWIYAPFCQSLIEIIPLDYIEIEIDNNQFTKTYQYVDGNGMEESFLFTFVQDNTDSKSEEVMNEAWEWYTKYLQWDDAQIM